MSALQELADEVGSLVTGFGLSTSRTAWLTNSVDNDDLNWIVDSTVSMGEGVAEIDDELVYVRRYAADTNALVVSPDGRGYDGTVAASHSAGSRIRIEPTFPRTTIKRAINTTIGRCFPLIWGVETVNLTYNVPVSTYELPAGTTKILGVEYDTWGPSGEWPRLNDYTFDGNADTTEYPSGRTITLGRAPTPNKPFRVTVAKAPTPLVDADASFSATGLSESARFAVVLGASAYLMRYTEPVRLTQTSAASDEYDGKKPYLTGTKLANDLEQQFQLELRAESQRLSQTYPARVHRRA